MLFLPNTDPSQMLTEKEVAKIMHYILYQELTNNTTGSTVKFNEFEYILVSKYFSLKILNVSFKIKRTT